MTQLTDWGAKIGRRPLPPILARVVPLAAAWIFHGTAAMVMYGVAVVGVIVPWLRDGFCGAVRLAQWTHAQLRYWPDGVEQYRPPARPVEAAETANLAVLRPLPKRPQGWSPGEEGIRKAA